MKLIKFLYLNLIKSNFNYKQVNSLRDDEKINFNFFNQKWSIEITNNRTVNTTKVENLTGKSDDEYMTLYQNTRSYHQDQRKQYLLHPTSSPHHFLTEAPKPTQTKPNLVSQNQQTIPNYQRGTLYRRDQSQHWPGTDTVYATKTVYISQAGPTPTLFVSNGQVVDPPQPTHCTMNCNNEQIVWGSPSPNPNIVVATVTAYSSAKKFAWDGFRSNPCSTLLVFFTLIHIFMILGFGLVNFGL